MATSLPARGVEGFSTLMTPFALLAVLRSSSMLTIRHLPGWWSVTPTWELITRLRDAICGKRLKTDVTARPSRMLNGRALIAARRASRASALTSFAAHSRARGDRHRPRRAERPARSAWSVQWQLAARFDGEVAGGAVADSTLVISGLGQTMELGRSGRSMMLTSASASYGVIDSDRQILQH
jgi:hypothetical protein